MIIGHGVDLVRVERIAGLHRRFGSRFLQRIYTEEEIDYCLKQPIPAESLAGRYAAKEAVYKILHRELEFLCWQEIEVITDRTGAPALRLERGARQAAERLGITCWHVSLSHERKFALASIIAEGRRR